MGEGIMPGAVAAAVGTAVAAIPAIAALGPVMAAMIGGIASFATSFLISTAFGLNKGPKMGDRGGGGSIQANRDRTISVRQAIAPHRVIYGQTRVGGIVTFLHTTDNNEELHQLITIAGHEVNSIGQVYLDDLAPTLSGVAVNSTKYSGHVDVYKGLGTTSGDSALNTALISNSESKWTSAHKQSGRAKIYTRFKFDQDTFSGNLPNVTALVQGRKVYDPRDESTAYSANPALCIRDYLTNTSFGLGEPTARINDTSFITAANECDEDVSLKAGGTEDRYTCNGVFETSELPKEILKKLLSSCAGKLVYQGGQWSLYAGAYVAPTISFDEDDLDGGMQVTTQVGRRNIFNTVRSVYTDPLSLYQPTDAPVVTSSTYKTEDQNEVITRDFDYAFTTSAATAQRLSKIELEKVRQQITVVAPVSLANGFRVQAGDTINLSNTRMGWSPKIFDIDEWKLVQRGTADAPTLGVDLVLRETASTLYNWTASSEETTVDAAPNTTFPDPFTAAAPTNLAVTEALYVTTNGSGVKNRAILTWTASADSFAQDYQVQHKLSADSNYIESGTARGGAVTLPINDIAAGTYDFRVKQTNTIGVSSAFNTITSQALSGLTANPADVTNLSVIALNNQAHISWDLATDLDVRHGGKIRFRHSNVSDGTAQWESSTDIGAAVAGHNTETVLPLLAGTYMARAVDSTGNESLGTVSFAITTVPNITPMNLIHTITCNPTFAGTLVGLDVVDGVLKFESDENFDDRSALMDTWTFFDSFTGVDTTGSYEFDGFDLGGVLTSRVTHDITFNTFEIGDYIDSRSGNVDDYTDWDNPPADLNLDLYVATTNDAVSGTPTWSEWAKFKTGDFTCRGYKFKLEAESTDDDHQFNVSALSVTIDMPDRVQGVRNITSGAGTKSVTYPSTFYAVPSLGISATNMATGDFFVITNETVTGFDVTFKNSSGTAVSRIFNYQSKGY